MHRIVIFLLFASMALADERLPWPKKANIDITFIDTPVSKIPKGIPFRQITVEDREPHPIGICSLDLNNDKVPELIVNTNEGGTGGTYLQIYQKRSDRFVPIAGWQGGILLAEPKNGYYQIETWSSGGGGESGRMLLTFEKGKYRASRLEHYRYSPDSEEPVFVKALDPKDYE